MDQDDLGVAVVGLDAAEQQVAVQGAVVVPQVAVVVQGGDDTYVMIDLADIQTLLEVAAF